MNSRSFITSVAIAVAAAACSSPPGRSDADGSWVGTITTEGNVTTVVNESGSVWGGTARLVEEASIGVAAGADEYMFGQVDSLYATDDRIYVVDSQVPAVRVYDHDGSFIRNLGGKGQGPGEYTFPTIVTADDNGRVFVVDARRINVYSGTGEILDTWPFPSFWCCVWPVYPLAGDAVWAPVRYGEDISDSRYGVQAVGADGPYGDVTWIPEIDYEPATFTFGEGLEDRAPFSAYLVWDPAPDGRLVVGASDTYSFEVHHPDGSRRIVRRFWEPVPVPAAHAEWERRRSVAFRRRYSDPDFTWDGAEIPGHKPAYVELIPALSGETWVVRWGASVRLTDCAEDPIEEGYEASYERPCWGNENIADVFDVDGRYLGQLDLPGGRRTGAARFSVDDRRVVALVEDTDGVARVKRYRLVLPADEGSTASRDNP